MKNGATGKRKMLGALLGVLLIWFFSGVAFANTLVTGVDIESVSSEYYTTDWDLRAIHVVDGSGFNGVTQTHDVTSPGGNSWQTITQSGTGNIKFDLGGVFVLDELHIWNLNFYSPYNGRGANQVVINTSLDLSSWVGMGTYSFQQASGIANDPGFTLDASNWGSARYVEFDILNSFGGSDNAGHVGLSEVRFFAKDSSLPVPEPTTMLLLGLGLVGLAGVRRKFQK